MSAIVSPVNMIAHTTVQDLRAKPTPEEQLMDLLVKTHKIDVVLITPPRGSKKDYTVTYKGTLPQGLPEEFGDAKTKITYLPAKVRQDCSK